MGGEGGFHEVLKQGLRLAVGEVEEGAEEKQGQVKAVVVAPGAAPLALGGGWSHLPGQAQAVFQHLLGACLPAKEASLAHQSGNIHPLSRPLQGKPQAFIICSMNETPRIPSPIPYLMQVPDLAHAVHAGADGPGQRTHQRAGHRPVDDPLRDRALAGLFTKWIEDQRDWLLALVWQKKNRYSPAGPGHHLPLHVGPGAASGGPAAMGQGCAAGPGSTPGRGTAGGQPGWPTPQGQRTGWRGG